MNSSRDKQTVVKLKKAFMSFDKAFNLMVIEDGDPSTFDYGTLPDGGSSFNQYVRAQRNTVIMQHLVPYFNIKETYYGDQVYYGASPYTGSQSHVTFNCKDKNNDSCKISIMGHPGVGFTTKDGVYYQINADGNFNAQIRCSGNESMANHLGRYWFVLTIDINGTKGPNALGEDTFVFMVTDQGLHPGFAANKNDTYDNTCGAFYVIYNCKKSRTGSFAGYSCGNYIMRHGDMKYKYKDLTDAEFY